MDIRAHFNKDLELLQQSLKVGDSVLSDGNLCELTQIGDDLIGQDPHVGTGGDRWLPESDVRVGRQ